METDNYIAVMRIKINSTESEYSLTEKGLELYRSLISWKNGKLSPVWKRKCTLIYYQLINPFSKALL
jgi:DNA-binding HxlR family transcriptional regulator